MGEGGDHRHVGGAARPAVFAGFVFVPGSPRHVTVCEAGPLAGLARKSGMLPVGVFRDAPLRTLADLATLMIDALQLRDVLLIEATVLVASTVYVGANMLADVGAILLNPRLRKG